MIFSLFAMEKIGKGKKAEMNAIGYLTKSSPRFGFSTSERAKVNK